jgi:hypothetical protein
MSEKIGRREALRTLTLAGAGIGLAALTGCGGKKVGSVATHPTPRPVAPKETAKQPEKYPEHRVMTTIFYIGEGASKDNAGINNISTEWESNAGVRFGGVDHPNKRDAKGLPAGFRPKENPYYFALPVSEFNDNGVIHGAREHSPWAAEAEGLPADDSQSLFKGRWIKTVNPATGNTVYGQWIDTGPSDDPNATHDYNYVFGGSDVKPRNTFGLRAGLDVSPTMAHELGLSIEAGGGEITWQFVDADQVPDGSWKEFPPIDNHTHWN